MTVTVASFRTAFPAFASTTVFPDTQVTFWMGLGLLLINVARWGNLADYGQMLFMAHNLSLEWGANRAAGSGQNPGLVQGALTGGQVDKVSYQRDPGAAMDPANGHWNLSIYGLRYIRLIKMVGAGPVQVGAPSGCDPLTGAWYGPWQYNFPNPS